MNQEEHVLLFNQQLDRLLADKMPDKVLSALDEQALECAHRLSQVNFSDESGIRDALYIRLVNISSTNNAKTARRWFPSFRVNAFQVQFVTWVRATLVLLSLLFFALGIPNPFTLNAPSISSVTGHPAIVSIDTALPTHNVHIQTLQPVPIPTPLAIPAVSTTRNNPPSAQVTKLSLSVYKPDIDQTPKPIPISLPSLER